MFMHIHRLFLESESNNYIIELKVENFVKNIFYVQWILLTNEKCVCKSKAITNVFDFCQPIWIALLWVIYRDITTDRMKWTQSSSFEIFPLLFFGVPFPNKTMVQQFVSMTNILYFNTWQWKHRHCWTLEVEKK